MPRLVDCPERFKDSEFVILDKSLSDGQVKSLASTLASEKGAFQQLYLSNNHLSGKMLAYLLRNLEPAVKDQVRSLILSDNNEFTEESLTVLLEDYMVKKGPSSLLELRLVDVKVSDQKIIFNLLTNLL